MWLRLRLRLRMPSTTWNARRAPGWLWSASTASGFFQDLWLRALFWRVGLVPTRWASEMVWSLPDADAQLGAVSRSHCKQLHPSLGRKKFNLVTWLPRQKHEASVGLLVLGDSYADNFDMGFECWQTLLARQCRLSSLNVACGGARISEYRSQLVTATAACGKGEYRHAGLVRHTTVKHRPSHALGKARHSAPSAWPGTARPEMPR